MHVNLLLLILFLDSNTIIYQVINFFKCAYIYYTLLYLYMPSKYDIFYDCHKSILQPIVPFEWKN